MVERIVKASRMALAVGREIRGISSGGGGCCPFGRSGRFGSQSPGPGAPVAAGDQSHRFL